MSTAMIDDFPKAKDRSLDPANYQPDEIVAITLESGRRFIRHGGCTKGCGACCEAIVLPHPPTPSEDYLLWLWLHSVEFDKDHALAHVPLRCKALREDGTCEVVGTATRPEMCSRYPRHPSDIATLEHICTYKFTEIEDGESSSEALQRILKEERKAGRPVPYQRLDRRN